MAALSTIALGGFALSVHEDDRAEPWPASDRADTDIMTDTEVKADYAAFMTFYRECDAAGREMIRLDNRDFICRKVQP